MKLKTPWRDGTTDILLTPLELAEKFVALIPPPRVNMIRFHGVFAPNAKLRARVVPAPATSVQEVKEDDTPRCTHPGRQSYAFLMKRVFATDVEQCPKCAERNTKIRFVTAKEEIEKILRSIGYPNAPGTQSTAA